MLKTPGLPIECHHMSWRDGGFSIPSLRDRSNVLSICSFAHMIFSKDPNIQNMAKAFIEHERRFRQITMETNDSPKFLNWKNVKGEQGTTSLINKARKAVKHLNVQLQIEGEWLIIKNSDVELKTKPPGKIGRFLTQKIIRSTLQCFQYRSGNFQYRSGNFQYRSGNFHFRCGNFHFRCGNFHFRSGYLHFLTRKIDPQDTFQIPIIDEFYNTLSETIKTSNEIYDHPAVYLERCMFQNCSHFQDGGAIFYTHKTGTFVMHKSIFYLCKTLSNGVAYLQIHCYFTLIDAATKDAKPNS
jgi:hypothetical protein